jgi:hypothetical protein
MLKMGAERYRLSSVPLEMVPPKNILFLMVTFINGFCWKPLQRFFDGSDGFFFISEIIFY